MLSIGYFTALQVLFGTVSIAPALIVAFVFLNYFDIAGFFATASLWAFIAFGLFIYLLGLIAPFAFCHCAWNCSKPQR